MVIITVNKIYHLLAVDETTGEDLERIYRYAGENIFRDICSKFNVTSPEGVAENNDWHQEAIIELMQKLEKRAAESDTTSSPRNTIRNILEEVNPEYGRSSSAVKTKSCGQTGHI